MTRVRRGLAAGLPRPPRCSRRAAARRWASRQRRPEAAARGPRGRGGAAQGGRDRRLSATGPARSWTARWSVPERAARQTVPDLPDLVRHPFRPNAMPAHSERGPRAGTAELLIFTSLSVPPASWRQWARDAARTGAPLVLRGVGDGGLPATAKRIGERLGGAEAGVAIDPRLFRLFGIERVPAVVVAYRAACRPAAAGAARAIHAPPHDRISRKHRPRSAALEAVADEGDASGAMRPESVVSQRLRRERQAMTAQQMARSPERAGIAIALDRGTLVLSGC